MTTDNIKIGDRVFYSDPRSPHYSARGIVEAIGDPTILRHPYRVRLENFNVAWAAPADLKVYGGQTPTTDPERVDADDLDQCPRHGADCRGEYDFGRYQDATLYVYKCGCAAVAENDVMSDSALLYPSYAAATGRARLIVAIHQDKFGR